MGTGRPNDSEVTWLGVAPGKTPRPLLTQGLSPACTLDSAGGVWVPPRGSELLWDVAGFFKSPPDDSNEPQISSNYLFCR